MRELNVVELEMVDGGNIITDVISSFQAGFAAGREFMQWIESLF